MSYARENGYVPVSFEEAMDFVRLGVNTQFGCSFTTETFLGTGYYKYFYILVQRVLENENKTADIFMKLTQYIATTNLRIQRPSVSLPGLIESFSSRGYVASIKENSILDAGTISIAVQLDSEAEDYEEKKLEVGGLIKDFVAAGLISEGDEEVPITLSNGQEFTFKFSLPTLNPIELRLTLKKSDNTLLTVPSDVVIRETLKANIDSKYRLGWDFEPQRYFTQSDAPWASEILLEYRDVGSEVWYDSVFEATFVDLYTYALEDIEVVIIP